jgi:predicted Fe-Mo cluster-binding NifX family protein
MTVAVSATDPSLHAPIDPHFGRCAWFVFVDPDTMLMHAVENAARNFDGGAGIQAARLVVDGGATAVLTGNCGPNAYRTLGAAGVGVVVGCAGTVAEAVGRFKAGELSIAAEPNVGSHAGSAGSR